MSKLEIRNKDALEYCKKEAMLEQMVGNETWKHYYYASRALEKQIPKKPVYSEYDDNGFDEIIPHKAECPTCGNEFEFCTWNEYDNHHCICGQAIDWSKHRWIK